jgi:hypothetical protein
MRESIGSIFVLSNEENKNRSAFMGRTEVGVILLIYRKVTKEKIVYTNIYYSLFKDHDTMSEDEETAPVSVWIGLSLLTLISFWSQATVTEER